MTIMKGLFSAEFQNTMQKLTVKRQKENSPALYNESSCVFLSFFP